MNQNIFQRSKVETSLITMKHCLTFSYMDSLEQGKVIANLKSLENMASKARVTFNFKIQLQSFLKSQVPHQTPNILKTNTKDNSSRKEIIFQTKYKLPFVAHSYQQLHQISDPQNFQSSILSHNGNHHSNPNEAITNQNFIIIKKM